MSDWHKNLKVYSPGYEATHWGFDYPQIVGIEEALKQPTKIAVLPVYYNRPTEFSHRPEFNIIDFSQFDLVLFTDIECRPQTEIMNWIATTGVTNWLLCVGGLWHNETLDPRTVYRPSWTFTFLQWNPPRDDFPLVRPYLFDCLCGTRRKHRDYVMLSLQQSGLLEEGIATYRSGFLGGDITETPDDVASQFPGLTVNWPYVSPNLNPAWEVKQEIDHSVSSIVPWDIYNRSYYSILVETLGYGDNYLMAEKIGKCFLGRRIFVHFGANNWLKRLRSFGFKTFDTIIDESYDENKIDLERWHAAFEQVKWLSKQNHPDIMLRAKRILDHNHRRLFEFREEKFKEMRDLIEPHLR